MTEQPISRVDKFLAGVQKPVAPGSLIFALDATASREPTWDLASELQASMFREIKGLGALDMQLIYFRGTSGVNAECKATGWVSDPMELARLMAKIRCLAGKTQIRKVLDHALRETSKRTVNAMVFVGNSCEERHDHLVTLAEELGRLKVPVFAFQEGRDPEAAEVFMAIAGASGGGYHRFDQGSAKQLGELLRAVAAFAVGGIKALEKQGSAAARLLLGQVR